MSNAERSATNLIDQLVRDNLERDAERMDPRALFQRIQASLPDASSSRLAARTSARKGGRIWRVATVAAAAAMILAGVILFPRQRSALAKVETVVREARQAHALPVDRCYLVEVRRESSLVAELAPAAPRAGITRLWTRGDRFWVESVRPDARWAWGRDDASRFWFAFGAHTAIRMEPDEVPYWLNVYCDLHSVNIEKWLAEVLNRFELTRESNSANANDSTITVHARARARARANPSIETADIEIDAETRVVRRMVVRRGWNGQPFATVTYTLAETDALDSDDYLLEGHLESPFEIYTRDHQPQRRKELLTRWLAPRSARWARTIEEMK
jgi:hypothetical protein